jgi:hypothetical protein
LKAQKFLENASFSTKSKKSSPERTPMRFVYIGAGGGIWTLNPLVPSPILLFLRSFFPFFPLQKKRIWQEDKKCAEN